MTCSVSNHPWSTLRSPLTLLECREAVIAIILIKRLHENLQQIGTGTNSFLSEKLNKNENIYQFLSSTVEWVSEQFHLTHSPKKKSLHLQQCEWYFCLGVRFCFWPRIPREDILTVFTHSGSRSSCSCFLQLSWSKPRAKTAHFLFALSFKNYVLSIWLCSSYKTWILCQKQFRYPL